MKIRLKKPLPQPSIGRVVPAGVIIDAPAALSERLLRLGIGTPAQDGEAPGMPVATPKKTRGKRSGRKRGTRNG